MDSLQHFSTMVMFVFKQHLKTKMISLCVQSVVLTIFARLYLPSTTLWVTNIVLNRHLYDKETPIYRHRSVCSHSCRDPFLSLWSWAIYDHDYRVNHNTNCFSVCLEQRYSC